MTTPPAPSPQSDNKTGFWFVHEPNYKYAIAGVPIVVGVLLFLAFFVSPWVSANADDAQKAAEDKAKGADKLVEEIADETGVDEDVVRDQLVDQFGGFGAGEEESKSAWAIWTGAENAVLRFDEDYKGEDGFGEVETRDRLLIFIPLLALGLIGVGVAYQMERLDVRRVLIATIVIAAILFLLPLLWQMLKTGYIRGGFKDLLGESPYSDEANDQVIDIAMASVTSIYSTFEFVFLSFVALLFSAGSYLILQSEHKRLGTNWPPPINPFPSSGSAGTAPPPVAPPAPPPSA
jgi:hypothetical protein